LTDNWRRRIETMGEATGPKPSKAKLVESPPPTSTPRQGTMSQLLTRPLTDLNYTDEIFGEINYRLIDDNSDYVTYLVTVRTEDRELRARWTALVWVFKRSCDYHTALIEHHKLSTPERVIHSGTGFTCEYARRRGNLDYILNGFNEIFGLTPYSVL